MSDIESAVVQHALDCGTTYLRNAHLNRGIPETPARLQVFPGDRPETAPAPAPAAQAASNAAGWIVPAIAGAASVFGSGGTAAALWLAGMLGGQQRPVPTPIVTAPAVRPASEPGSLLQWLEDRGYNVPPDERAVRK